jgi:hypothetical protein
MLAMLAVLTGCTRDSEGAGGGNSLLPVKRKSSPMCA